MKSDLTNKIETALLLYCAAHGHIAVQEVQLSRHGIVDVLSLEVKKPWTKNPISVWRCYEIKSSVADFKSQAKKSFIGDLNYYVMPIEVYQKVMDLIPKDIGCFVYEYNSLRSVKRATQSKARLAEITFVRRLTGSLAREVRKANDVFHLIQELRDDVIYWKDQYSRAMKENYELKERVRDAV